MRIVFFIGSLNNGGAERVISNISNYISSHFNDKVSIILNSDKRIGYDISNKIKLYCLDDKKYHNWFFRNVNRICNLRKFINELNPDIIISFLPEQNFRVLILKKMKLINSKIIISIRNDPKFEYPNNLYKLLVKLLYNKANGIVFQTQEAKEYFSDKIQKKSKIIPNPINEKFINKKFHGVREKNIVSVGRLEEQKNHKLLIQAYSELPTNLKSQYKFIIYGEGSLKEVLQKQIKELNCEKNIILKGKVKNIEEKIYKDSIFVLSSNYEGMPNSLMEAMALGLACISTNCSSGGPNVLINNKKNGILINVGDRKQLKKALLELINDNKYMEKISINSIESMKEYLPEKINKIWKDYIDKIYKERN